MEEIPGNERRHFMSNMRMLLARASASCLATTAIVAGMVVMAAPAQANASDCVQYLTDRGYRIGPDSRRACRVGASGNEVIYWAMCDQLLAEIGVRSRHSRLACDLAQS
jgi:hypothetical protein